jgi:hypothetical protein
MSVSAVVVTYRRVKSIEQVLGAWLGETPDVWLCDCTPRGINTKLPVHIVRAHPDPGNRIRHAVALLTAGDLVIKADDDIVPLPGLAADFTSAWRKYGEAIYGIHGRIFGGERYYIDTRLIGAKKQTEARPVDFVGVITAAPRSLLPMDLRSCPSAVEDLYWQMKRYPAAAKYVIATDKFRNLPECRDEGRLCGTKKSRDVRRDYYTQLYRRNYKGKAGRWH